MVEVSLSGLRICHVVGDSAFGGGALVVLDVATAAARAGASVAVMTTNTELAAQVALRNLEVIELDCIRRSIRPISDLRGLLRLQRHFEDRHYDMVHTHTSKAGFVGRIAARRAGVPVVLHTIHGFAFHEASPAWLVRSVAALEKFAGRHGDAAVTVSEFHREWALRLGIGRPKDLVAIPNGIAPAVVLDASQRARLRRELGVEDHEALILSAGRLARGKGLELLPAVAARLSEYTTASFRFVLPGEGPLEGVLRECIQARGQQARFVLPGFRRDARDLIECADYVVLPSEREGLSIAMLEAMAAGKPIVASAIGSNLEATGNGRCAELRRYGDVDGFARALGSLMGDDVRAAALGKAAKLHFVENYGRDRMVSSYMRLYAQLAYATGEHTGSVR